MQLTVHCHPFLTVPEATSRPLVLRQVRCFVIMSSDSVAAHSSNQFWTWLISSLSGFCICRFFTFCILKISYCLCKDVRLLFFFFVSLTPWSLQSVPLSIGWCFLPHNSLCLKWGELHQLLVVNVCLVTFSILSVSVTICVFIFKMCLLFFHSVLWF